MGILRWIILSRGEHLAAYSSQHMEPQALPILSGPGGPAQHRGSSKNSRGRWQNRKRKGLLGQHCRLLSSIPASAQHPSSPNVTTKTTPTWPNVSWGQTHPWLGTTVPGPSRAAGPEPNWPWPQRNKHSCWGGGSHPQTHIRDPGSFSKEGVPGLHRDSDVIACGWYLLKDHQMVLMWSELRTTVTGSLWKRAGTPGSLTSAAGVLGVLCVLEMR